MPIRAHRRARTSMALSLHSARRPYSPKGAEVNDIQCRGGGGARSQTPSSTNRVDKWARLRARLRDPEWRRYGKLLLAGKLLGVVMLLGIIALLSNVF